MVFFYIKDNSYCGEKVEKAVGVLAGLRDEAAGVADADIAADGIQDTAHGDSGIQSRFQENLGGDGGRSGLAVCAGDGDGGGIILHDLAHHGAPRHNRDSEFDGPFVFRVIRFYGRCIYNKGNIVSNIFLVLSIYYLYAEAFQMSGYLALMPVGASDGKAHGVEKLCKSAHADAADSDKMNSAGLFEINFIHK